MNPCIESTIGWKHPEGYYIFNRPVAGEYRVTRYLYKEHIGELLPSEEVRHTCDHPWCVELTHLLKGSHQDNIDDMVNRGRNAKGEKHGSAKLTKTEVLEIRQRHENGVTQKQLAMEYGISKGHMSAIIHREYWK